MKEPNREPALGYGELHTIEHLAATYLRNHPVWGERIVFWGPMGCCTGNYFLMKGDLQAKDIVELMRETFRFIRDFEGEVPGAAPRDCGNYLLHNLPMAKYEADKYLREVLEVIEEKKIWCILNNIPLIDYICDYVENKGISTLDTSNAILQ